MNKENAAEFLPLVQALAEGKAIQYNSTFGGWTTTEWINTENMANRYRIKPEPREIWLNHYEHDVKLGPYGSKDEAAASAGDFATQVCYREVIE